jgi:hypothetical protein
MSVTIRTRRTLSFGRTLFTVAAFALLLGLTACTTSPSGPSEEDRQQAQTLADEGFTLLITALNAETPNVTTLNLAKAKFEDALELDEENGDANVGLALTEFVLVAFDPSVQALVGGTPVLGIGRPVATAGQGLSRVLAFDPTPAGSLLSVTGILDGFRTMLTKPAQTGPDLEAIQTVLETVMLPMLDHVVTLFAAVEGLDDWSLVLTPAQTGMLEGNLEIDQTDIYAVDVEVHAFKALIHIMVAYNMNFPALMDTTEVKAAFNQATGTFMKLRTNGATNMQSARTAMLDAISRANSFMTSLQAETDSQVDDLIKLDPTGDQGPSADDLAGIATDLAKLYVALNGPQDITEDFDDDGVDETLSVDLSVLFTSPISDMKALQPPYSWDSEYQMFFWDGYMDEDFSQFIFPDPTMHGLFPDLNTDAAFKAFFDITDFLGPGPFYFGFIGN